MTARGICREIGVTVRLGRPEKSLDAPLRPGNLRRNHPSPAVSRRTSAIVFIKTLMEIRRAARPNLT